MTHEYARRSNGQIEINGPHGWTPHSRLSALCDLEVLKASSWNYHKQQIEELKEALRETE